MNEPQKSAEVVREAEQRAKRLGLNPADLHAAAGVHRATWNRWRAGEGEPALSEWSRVQALLDGHEQVA